MSFEFSKFVALEHLKAYGLFLIEEHYIPPVHYVMGDGPQYVFVRVQVRQSGTEWWGDSFDLPMLTEIAAWGQDWMKTKVPDAVNPRTRIDLVRVTIEPPTIEHLKGMMSWISPSST